MNAPANLDEIPPIDRFDPALVAEASPDPDGLHGRRRAMSAWTPNRWRAGRLVLKEERHFEKDGLRITYVSVTKSNGLPE